MNLFYYRINTKTKCPRALVNNIKTAKKAFIDFYSDKAIIRLHDRVEYYAKQLGLTPDKITIKDMAYRWTSGKLWKEKFTTIQLADNDGSN